jgi:hypothetical protein
LSFPTASGIFTAKGIFAPTEAFFAEAVIWFINSGKPRPRDSPKYETASLAAKTHFPSSDTWNPPFLIGTQLHFLIAEICGAIKESRQFTAIIQSCGPDTQRPYLSLVGNQGTIGL